MSKVEPVIIDVREPAEFATGHVNDAINLPLGTLSYSAERMAIAKDTPIVTYCNSGRRSGQAVRALEQLGYTNVTNGISQAHVETSFSRPEL